MKRFSVPMVLLLIVTAISITACGGSSKHASSAAVNEISHNKEVQSTIAGERSVVASCVEKVRNPVKGFKTVEKCLTSQGVARPQDRKCIETWAKHELHKVIVHGLPSRKSIVTAITGCVKTK